MSMANEIKNISEKDDSNFFVRFVKYFVPWKGDKSAEVVRKIVFIFSIFIFVFSINELTDFLKSDQEQIDYAQEIVKYEPDFDDLNLNDVSGDAEDGADIPESSDKERKVQSWAKDLLKRNDEVVGWIKIPGFVNSNGEEYINFPVLQHVTDNIDEGNNYYLKRNLDEEYYDSGSIFADCVIPIDKDGQADNITIYGHHMRKLGTSFTHLAEYKDGVDFLKKYPVIEFNTIYDSGEKYVIIGCFVAAAEDNQDDIPIFDYWRYRNFDDDEYSFESWIDNVRKQSWYSSDVECTEDDDYISLSTCSNEVSDMRWVIVAKKMTADDNLDLIVESYEERDDKDIYFPKCWRNVWGNNKKYLGWSY
ncbi:class B sortase [Ruminococcus sp. Marseille-P6503]|uniref:class B sortase n=1 Tax=Ruminococcus sp. Marseille-P6503 TaxID=2364796 RepID=UPI000F543AA6|nr:class B sortase [Ruminococcus sp. Marseille-P6503]